MRHFLILLLGCSSSSSPSAPPATDAGPSNVLMVAGGTFTMGCNKAIDAQCNENPSDNGGDEEPAHAVTLKGFWLDEDETTQQAYAQCISAGACSAPFACSGGNCPQFYTAFDPQANPSVPVSWITWEQAVAYCTWRGMRLPTEAEWEWAARGGERGTRYPWGNEAPRDRACWDGDGNPAGRGDREGTCPVASFPRGDAPSGVSDLAGGVREWTATADGGTHVVRGGSWGDTEPTFLASSFRGMNGADDRLELTGFRCAAAPGSPVVDPVARASERQRARERAAAERAERRRKQGKIDLDGVKIYRDPP